MRFDSHTYAGPADMEAMVDLVSMCWHKNGPRTRFHVGDIYWWMRSRGPSVEDPNIRLWTDEQGTAAGFAWLYSPHYADVLIRPDRRGSGIELEILHWLEERAPSIDRREAREPILEIGGYDDPQWESCLEGQSYVRGKTAIVHFWRSLGKVPNLMAPPGFHVQESRGEQDAVERDTVLGLSFSRSDPRLEMYLNAMRMPGYREDLDLAVVSDSGEQVAMCICWLDSNNKVGEFEPVGCHPDYRRKGLALAMMVEGLRRLKALGAESAVVYTWDTNEPAIRLYKSCGFRQLFVYNTFELT